MHMHMHTLTLHTSSFTLTLTLNLTLRPHSSHTPFTLAHTGEALRPNVCRAFHAGAFPIAEIHNLYGPTEADMTSWTSPSRGTGEARSPNP